MKHRFKNKKGDKPIKLVLMYIVLMTIVFSVEIIEAKEQYQLVEPDLRIITYNLRKFKTLTVNKVPSLLTPIERATTIGRALARYEPTIVALQEVPATKAELVQQVAKELGMTTVLMIPPEGAILSRLPVVEQSFQSLSLPGGHGAGFVVVKWGKRSILCFTTHLKAFRSPENSVIRMRQIAVIEQALRPYAADDLIVMGDLNHFVDTPEYAAWQSQRLVDLFVRVGSGEANTRLSSNPLKPPTKRLDYIWGRGTIVNQVHSVRVLNDPPFIAGDHGSYALSDHLPVMAVFTTRKITQKNRKCRSGQIIRLNTE